ncbi:hypothetical protein J437_LFUL019218, partial [Ladona fulva]
MSFGFLGGSVTGGSEAVIPLLYPSQSTAWKFLLLVGGSLSVELEIEITTVRWSEQQDPDLPHEFGLYYAMGVSLISEGLLSGAYHICPRGSNFQF